MITLNSYLSKTYDSSPLIVFRIGFGLLMLISLIRFWSNGWIEELYITPQFHFSYYGFEWVKPIGYAFCEKYLDKPFVCTTAIFVKLAANSNIANHSDSHPYFGVTHRIHWCIDGDYENMHFMIAGHRVEMYAGDAIEINNRLPHSVAYTGEIPRINGIIDYMEVPPVEKKEESSIPVIGDIPPDTYTGETN